MQLIFTVTEGPHAGEVIRLQQHSVFLVGRSADAHLSLPEDRHLSRLHFMLEFNPPLCRLVHMGKSATTVNGQPVKLIDLKHGDEIRAGNTALQLVVDQSDAESERTLSQPPIPPSQLSPKKLSLEPATPDPRQAVPQGAKVVPASPAGESKVLVDSRAFPVIPGYELQQEVGSGGMGTVYLAFRQSDGSRVAIKTIHTAVRPTQEASERFLREANIMRELQHPHIVPFHEMGQQGWLLYFVMDFITGTDARNLLKQTGPLPVPRAVRLICQLLDGLAYAHNKGFVHRDVKPANLMVTTPEEEERCLLTDFGLARTYQASALSGLTMTGSPGGTPGFMPPEQVLDFRTAQPPADLYATAATLYRLLTNSALYDGVDKAYDLLFRATLHDDPIPIQTRRPDLPADLARIIHKALSRDPRQRYPHASTFREALLPFAQT